MNFDTPCLCWFGHNEDRATVKRDTRSNAKKVKDLKKAIKKERHPMRRKELQEELIKLRSNNKHY